MWEVFQNRVLQLSRKVAIPCLSVLIALIWSVQFIVSVPLSLMAHDIQRSWPIVNYPMYSEPHFKGDKIPRLAVVGICRNGDEIDIRPEDIGGGYWYFQVFARAAKRADEDIMRDMVRMYETRHNVHLSELRVENRPLLWNNGKVEAAPIEILRSSRLDAAQR
jgi:hypothetical protein